MNPYLAGVGVGVALLAAFLLAGRGLGATGAYSSVVAGAAQVVAPEHAAQSQPYAAFLGDADSSPLADWLVLEIAGVLLGAFLSAVLAGRVRLQISRPTQVSAWRRLQLAASGGLLMGFGAKLARGCTSGQGLTGGALFSVGSWLFIASAFALAYLLAPLVRKQWR
ncbi:MAG: YeeE/YedE thiosulfate transporter family protein [Pseudomonadota bacterium]